MAKEKLFNLYVQRSIKEDDYAILLGDIAEEDFVFNPAVWYKERASTADDYKSEGYKILVNGIEVKVGRGQGTRRKIKPLILKNKDRAEHYFLYIRDMVEPDQIEIVKIYAADFEIG